MPGRRRKMPFMNRLSMDERQSIIGLLRLRWPERRIARETGFHRATIRRMRPRAGRRARPKCTDPKWPPTKCPPVARRSCEPHRSFIEAEAAKGRNAVAIYQDLVEHHGYDGAYNAVKRFVGKLRPAEPKDQLPVRDRARARSASRLRRRRADARIRRPENTAGHGCS